jgi:hypothetical protein
VNGQNYLYTGLGIAFGAALGVFLYLIFGQVYYMGVGVAIGLLLSAAKDLQQRGTHGPGNAGK